MAALALPPPEVLRNIAQKQELRAKEIRARRLRELSLLQEEQHDDSGQRETAAAQLIQRNYRGYRERRALQGYGLDPSTRWLEAIREVKYSHATTPLSRATWRSLSNEPKHPVRDRWRRIKTITHRAGSDFPSDDDELSSDEQPSTSPSSANDEAQRERRRQLKLERERNAKIMGLEYFLEMVDQKHRYGSNLRRYHQEWKTAETKENFFFWLDHGEGKDVDLPDRPRSRLDTEQVRYLSREERKHYLVTIDHRGRFCWDKDGKPVNTSREFKDSIDGIVPATDRVPTWREVMTGKNNSSETTPEEASPTAPEVTSTSPSSPSSDTDASRHAEGPSTQVTSHNDQHHSLDSALRHLSQRVHTKQSTWIFVADTSFRMYIGIKQSGAFQHSSFLQGARVSAAGLIKIKNGVIRQLSPLSGHYAPPVRNFRLFLHALHDAGADLHRLNVSRSYAVILGLEGYLSVKKRATKLGQGVEDILKPEKKQQREELTRDKSKSAEKERRFLEAQERERQQQKLSYRLLKKLRLHNS